MKSKWKFLINTILLLNIVYIGLFSYNRYIKKAIINNVKKNDVNFINDSKDNSEIMKFDYGDKIQNHILTDISCDTLYISNSNERFKYLEITNITPINDLKVDADFFIRFNVLRKNIKNKNILYIFLLGSMKIDYNDKRLLTKFQEKFDVHFVTVSNSFIINKYRVSNLYCGSFTILLDKNNVVRFANSGIQIETIFNIINNELNKNGN